MFNSPKSNGPGSLKILSKSLSIHRVTIVLLPPLPSSVDTVRWDFLD
ncbi:MAG: hypothetical protein ACJZ8O_06055 [Pirellulaceae bacterium]